MCLVVVVVAVVVVVVVVIVVVVLLFASIWLVGVCLCRMFGRRVQITAKNESAFVRFKIFLLNMHSCILVK